MAKRINNMNDLEKALMPAMKGMVDKLTERVYETLNYFLQEYYDDYDPKSYRRQYEFLRSAVKVESRIKRDTTPEDLVVPIIHIVAIHIRIVQIHIQVVCVLVLHIRDILTIT